MYKSISSRPRAPRRLGAYAPAGADSTGADSLGICEYALDLPKLNPVTLRLHLWHDPKKPNRKVKRDQEAVTIA